MQRILEDMEQVAHAMDSKVFRYIGEGQAVSFERFERFDLLAFDWYDVDGRCSDSEKVTVIFLPLTLLTGWFGMNFVHMPVLQLSWAYPALIGVCIAIVAGLLWFFRHKKWL